MSIDNEQAPTALFPPTPPPAEQHAAPATRAVRLFLLRQDSPAEHCPAGVEVLVRYGDHALTLTTDQGGAVTANLPADTTSFKVKPPGSLTQQRVLSQDSQSFTFYSSCGP